ncbi:unnamed protein product [Aphanomyces euteiches]|uniref:Uncharacterized protein n=1 Tax=Aphanomyces euteiches TaxID=100861 RepID=A0A6G0X6N2_9STRA|nr:hypothetical protein Ae201684_007982 [Aphanomyces euteiches]KAH9074421.1 hypothetical protein Ae201684P_022228 [Aphanomyces euteiches]KAH9088123.1 hypothetical protein LEN26_019641 [Aphanomyces euteiches]KAH9106272.1 hypothetical protein AeMF1_018082 [Aphanomyces euteiches]KAH9133021.1 hypothetical protein AeRB84_020786 [Aphanomyces euteiches]
MVVTFSTATEYTFRVGYSFSTVTSDAVPGIGLFGKAVAITTSPVSDSAGSVSKYTRPDRIAMLQKAGLSPTEIINLSKDQATIQVSRRSCIQSYLNDYPGGTSLLGTSSASSCA